ncbi:uncharacterized protein LOC122663000 [Telopea speciosissima]|uniref:uncharacterized protein LOC122663000 n=1 Tax=Telopea speciosissima TaxID=54955 RepID=UPI001CC46156|nr:uncharacterized protein LOC122663000 [Telopea speciosissima]
MKKLRIKQENGDEDSEDELICPKKENTDESDDEDPQVKKSSFKKKKSFPKKKHNYKKKSLITHKDNTTTDESSEDEESDDENYETLFMATSTNDIEEGEKSDKEEEQLEDEYDLQAELYTALKKLKVERKKIKILETQLAKESEKISRLSLIIEKTKKINEDISFILSSKIDEYTQFEEEIITLRAECKEVSVQTLEEDHHEVHESIVLDEILSVQRPSNDKSGLGYEKGGVSSGVKTKGQGMAQNPVRFIGEKRKKNGSNSENSDTRKVDKDGFTAINHHRSNGYNRNSWQIQRFNEYCYGCNMFGHRVAECRRNEKPINFLSKNKFAALADDSIECYRCRKIGHLARNCKTLLPSQRQAMRSQKQTLPNRQH